MDALTALTLTAASTLLFLPLRVPETRPEAAYYMFQTFLTGGAL